MDDWIEAAALDDVGEERPLPREIHGVAVALVRRGDRVVGFLDRCPHMHFPLSEGHMVDGQIECSLHHWRFDVFDDPPPGIPPEVVCSFVETSVRDGLVFVRLPA